MATVALPSEEQIALMHPHQNRAVMANLAATIGSLRQELAQVESSAELNVADVGLNAAGAFTAGVALKALEARVAEGKLSERWLNIGGGIDPTLLGSLALAIGGIALAKYGDTSADEPEAATQGEGAERGDEAWYSVRNLGAGVAKVGVGGVMLWVGRMGGKAYGAFTSDEPEEEGGEQAA